MHIRINPNSVFLGVVAALVVGGCVGNDDTTKVSTGGSTSTAGGQSTGGKGTAGGASAIGGNSSKSSATTVGGTGSSSTSTSALGGATSTVGGMSNAVGGASGAVGGSSNTVGGALTVGGSSGSSTAFATGGSNATGGSTAGIVGGTSASLGGNTAVPTGGLTSTSATTDTTISATGGAPPQGGSAATGGAVATGGVEATGGTATAATGGTAAAGGVAATGGGASVGGTTAEGGSGGNGAVVPPVTDIPSDGGSAVSGPLLIKVTSSQNPALQGKRVQYTITIGNTSEVAVNDVSLLLRLPEGLQFYYTDDATPDSSSCGNGTCSPNEEATWTIATIPAGATETIFVNPVVLSTVGDSSSLALGVRLSATGVNPVSFTKTIEVSTIPSAELTLGSTMDPALPGQQLELAFDVGNVGAVSIFDGEIHAYLPVGLTAIGASSGGTTAAGGQEITWPVASLGVGATLHRTATVQVASGLAAGQVLNAQATFAYEGGDDVDQWVQLPISVVAARPKLSLTLDANPSPAKANGLVLYTATIANTSLRAVDGVSLVMRVPREESYYYTTNAEPDSSSCGNGTCSSDEEAVFTIGTLAAGASQTVSINPTVLQSAAGDGTLLTSLFALRATSVNPINLYKTVPVNGAAAGQLTLGAGIDPVIPGQSFTYDLDVGQVGAASLFGSELKFYVPAGLSVQTISEGGTESPTGVIAWDLGDVAVGATARRSVIVTVDADLPPATLLESHATLTYEGGAELDASADFTSTVVAAALPLAVSVAATPEPATLGGRISYTTTITNTSSRAVDGISLLYRLPTGLSWYYTTDADPDSSSCGNGTCSEGEEATWTIGTLAPGASQIVTVNSALSASAVVGGSIVTLTGRLTAANLGGTINLHKSVATKR